MHSPDRVFGLDLMRAFAILFVVLGHGNQLLPAHALPGIREFIVFDGVTIFFVLSGFLIGRILLRAVLHEQFDGRMLLTFWMRRWFRTLPNYYFVLALLIVLTKALGDNTPPRPDNLPFYFAFAQNLAWQHPEFFGEAWSLAVEEWFYLCVPLPLYIATKIQNVDRRRVVLYCIAVVIIGSTAIRLARAGMFYPASEIDWAYSLKMQVVTRMDSLMIGVLGAYFSIHHREKWITAGAYTLPLGLALLIFDQIMRSVNPSIIYLNFFALSVAPIASFMLLPRMSTWYARPGVIVNTVTFISLTSYSIYLLNQAPILETILPTLMPHVMHYFWRLSDYTWAVTYATYWLLTISASYLLYRYYERPMMNLRDRWPAKSRPSPVHAEIPAVGPMKPNAPNLKLP